MAIGPSGLLSRVTFWYLVSGLKIIVLRIFVPRRGRPAGRVGLLLAGGGQAGVRRLILAADRRLGGRAPAHQRVQDGGDAGSARPRAPPPPPARPAPTGSHPQVPVQDVPTGNGVMENENGHTF